MTERGEMRDTDRKARDRADASRSVHHGPLGRMLERFLHQADPPSRAYTMLELDELWRRAAARDPAIGLHLFATYTQKDWHPLVYLAQLCAHVGEAIDYGVRYAPLISNMERVSRVKDGGLVGVELDLDAPKQLTRYLAEHYSVMTITQLRRCTGTTVVPSRTEFTHARPPYHALYRQWFGNNVKFGTDRGRMFFTREVLRRPMQAANAAVMELISSELDRRLSLRRTLEGRAGKVALKVRSSLLHHGVLLSLEDVGRELGQSPRTLRRRLADEGITYRALLDQVRMEIEQLLEHEGLTRGEIAVRLGYGALAAYLHARQRWHSTANTATRVDDPAIRDGVSVRRASRSPRRARRS